MSIVIIGGNECMERRYLDLCKSYDCKAKIYAKMKRGLQNIGSPDLLVLFTSTMSHKMLRTVMNETKGTDTRVVRCQSSSMNALRGVLDEHTKGDSAIA